MCLCGLVCACHNKEDLIPYLEADNGAIEKLISWSLIKYFTMTMNTTQLPCTNALLFSHKRKKKKVYKLNDITIIDYATDIVNEMSQSSDSMSTE